jgi:50S ribosome-binding GTPase
VRERALDLAVDIYVIGAANVGKSTFINHLLQDKSIVKKGKASTRNKLLSQGLTVRSDDTLLWSRNHRRYCHRSVSAVLNAKTSAECTTVYSHTDLSLCAMHACMCYHNNNYYSIVPGTTLDFLRVDLGDNACLYDTPGLILPHQLTSRLNPEELKVTLVIYDMNMHRCYYQCCMHTV